MTAAREAADLIAILAHHQALAVVLDLMNPFRPRWGSRHFRRLARFEEAGWRRIIMVLLLAGPANVGSFTLTENANG